MNNEQLIVLKAAIFAETDALFVEARQSGNNSAMATWFGLDSSPAFYVWRSSVDVESVLDGINMQALTPTDVASAGDSAQVAAAQTNRTLLCQAKQMNLQLLLQGRQTINATKLRVRQALTDSLLNVPSGVGGALQDAGWAQVKQALYRVCNRGERLFASGIGTTGVPGLLSWEGQVTRDNILDAMAV